MIGDLEAAEALPMDYGSRCVVEHLRRLRIASNEHPDNHREINQSDMVRIMSRSPVTSPFLVYLLEHRINARDM